MQQAAPATQQAAPAANTWAEVLNSSTAESDFRILAFMTTSRKNKGGIDVVGQSLEVLIGGRQMVSIAALLSASRQWSGAAWRSAGGRPALGRATGTAAGAQAAQAAQATKADAAGAAMQQGWGWSQQPISAAAGALPACHSSARTNKARSHWRAVVNMGEV